MCKVDDIRGDDVLMLMDMGRRPKRAVREVMRFGIWLDVPMSARVAS